jgi:hypothetical protein
VLLFGALAFWLVSKSGMPWLVMLVAVCAIGADLLMRRTRFGSQLYAIGGNPEAARLSGINSRGVVLTNFVIAGLAYRITGIALTARVSRGGWWQRRPVLELDAIAAAIIGGTSLTGGRGRVFGAMVRAGDGQPQQRNELDERPDVQPGHRARRRAAARGPARTVQPSTGRPLTSAPHRQVHGTLRRL